VIIHIGTPDLLGLTWTLGQDLAEHAVPGPRPLQDRPGHRAPLRDTLITCEFVVLKLHDQRRITL